MEEDRRYNGYSIKAQNVGMTKNQDSRRVSFHNRDEVRYIDRDLKNCDRDYLEAADLILNHMRMRSKRRNNLIRTLKRLICDLPNDAQDSTIDEERIDASLLKSFKDAFNDRLKRLQDDDEISETEADFITRKIFHAVQLNGWPKFRENVR